MVQDANKDPYSNTAALYLSPNLIQSYLSFSRPILPTPYRIQGISSVIHLQGKPKMSCKSAIKRFHSNP